MIVSDDVVDICRALALLLAGEGQKLWATPLSPTGTAPATHWISSGMIEAQFGELLPLNAPVFDGEVWVDNWLSAGNSALLAELSGGSVTEAQVVAIFAQCDVTLEEPQAALARLVLRMVQHEEVM